MSHVITRACLIGAALLSLLHQNASAENAEAGVARVSLVVPKHRCDQARLGELDAKRGDRGSFEFVLSTEAPAFHRLECGGAFELYLAAGDRLRMTIDADGVIAFSGKGSVANRYLSAETALSIAALSTRWRLPRSEFVSAWAALHASDMERLTTAGAQGADRALVERERVRLQLLWAQGRVLYPYFHWRETAAQDIATEPELAAIVGKLPLAEPRWWSLAEHQDFLDAYLHALARAELREDESLRNGDIRWLRAEWKVLHARIGSAALRLRQATRMLARHIEENGARGIEPIEQSWRQMGPDAAALEKIDAAIAADRAQRDGHEIATYREVDGVELEIHVLEPTNATATDARPAMLWLHGGSWTQGTWWHSPGVTTALRAAGAVVFAVELRNGNRFDAGPLEQLADASAAFRWVRSHAKEHRIDPARIGVAGFSSGATLALLVATRGFDPDAATGSRTTSVIERPAAVVAMGACANPIGPSEDGWFRKQVARVGRPAQFSPVALVGAGMPRLLAIHASEDEFCDYGETKSFVLRYQAAGNQAELVSVNGVGHFFGFWFKPGQALVRDSISAALRRWQWSDGGTSD